MYNVKRYMNGDTDNTAEELKRYINKHKICDLFDFHEYNIGDTVYADIVNEYSHQIINPQDKFETAFEVFLKVMVKSRCSEPTHTIYVVVPKYEQMKKIRDKYNIKSIELCGSNYVCFNGEYYVEII
jgi:hypothetical protein